MRLRSMLLLTTVLSVAPLHAQSVIPGLRPYRTEPAIDPAPRDPSLRPVFDQFGRKPGLVALMDDFMVELMADPRTRPFFAHVKRRHVKAELVDQFCVILDGPCRYTGKDMTRVHDGLDIHRSEFDALIEDLQKAMDKHHIPFRAQNKLLARLAPMYRQMVVR